MKVLKFGGTSIASPERMQRVVNLITADKSDKIVVLSAISQTTNTLERINKAIKIQDFKFAHFILEQFKKHYYNYIEKLYYTDTYKEKATKFVDKTFHFIESLFHSDEVYSKTEKIILVQGEILSTNLMQFYFESINISTNLISSFEIMKTDQQNEPDLTFLTKTLCTILKNKQKVDYTYIIQGYICLNKQGEIDNLGRGGSDYTACLVGAAIKASEIQIWTDIDGMHNNDPRIVKKTMPVHYLSFVEAAELAYFGAKILHPTCILPAQQANIPVRLLNTLKPESKGTCISDDANQLQPLKGKIKAIAAKDNITVIRIRSSRMLLAYGFLSALFDIFKKYKTSIDMITTSEITISLTIDNTKNLKTIVKELEDLGEVEVTHNRTIICIVGQQIKDVIGIESKIFSSINNISVKMVSSGASSNNISFLINQKDKINVLQSLNKNIFGL